MSIQFRCPSCDAQLAAAEQWNSARFDCPQCSASLLVPDPTAGDLRELCDAGPLMAEEAPVDFHTRGEKSDVEMDMTPMVDVTFLLLIFFMVTAAFSMQKSFQVPTPKDEQTSSQAMTLQDFEDNPDFVVVHVDQYSTFYVSAAHWDEQREAPNMQDLLVNLADARMGDGSGTIPTRLLVVAHGNAYHRSVVTAMDAGTEVGMEDVKLVTVEADRS